MTAHPVTLKVSANVPKDCSFWPEDDSWNGVCEELSLTIRGSSEEKNGKQHYRRTSSVSCKSIPGRAERGSPDKSQKLTLQFASDLETPDS